MTAAEQQRIALAWAMVTAVNVTAGQVAAWRAVDELTELWTAIGAEPMDNRDYLHSELVWHRLQAARSCLREVWS
jgi:hypothetical protein